jgi:aldehyde dehydrogenase (NAD+)
MNTNQTASISAEIDVFTLFQNQKNNANKVAQSTAKERIAKLKSIQNWCGVNEQLIKDAMYLDFKKPGDEVMIGEVMGVLGELKHLISNLSDWMKPKKLNTPLNMIGSSSYIKYEPKGVCLIISPWNYPFNLAIKPLAQAIAAGNTVILKPSELTPNTSALIAKMLGDLFSPDEITVVEGGVEASTDLLALPFNHIFFTGSPSVGKVVMSAAAKNLCSVTLELGGKSPCIVDDTASIKKSAKRIAWGKWLNNGQTCVAPDYVLVHEKVKDEFIEQLKKSILEMYSPEGQDIERTPDYCRIVNNRHYNRVEGLLNGAVQQGANVYFGGKTNAAENYMSPTILTDVNDDMKVMQEEIFGPILPIVPFKHLDEALAAINKREKPLALYIASSSNKNIENIIANTSAGDTVINDTVIHYGNVEMPFGGVNNSGIGKSGGIFGFQEFSNARGIMRQRFGDFSMIYPPYTKTTSKLVNFFVKYL